MYQTVKCSNWKKCGNLICRHRVRHNKTSLCADSCDEPGYTGCKRVYIGVRKQPGSVARSKKQPGTVERTKVHPYMSDLDTKYFIIR